MKRFIVLTLISIAVLSITVGCSQKDIERENERLREDLDLARERIRYLDSWMNDLKEQIDMKEAYYESEYQRLEDVYKELISDLENEIDKGEIVIRKMKGALKLNIADRIFFESGDAEIKSDGEAVLKKIGKILKKIPEKMIRIEGHTDNIPVGKTLKKKYETNWELASKRSVNVVRYLHEIAKIAPSRLSAVSYSQYCPIISNKTEKGRAKNRRIEIILVDKEAYQLMKKEKGFDEKAKLKSKKSKKEQ
ncbi:MAG: OmpA family protein [Spirochaetota bacterium]|nr:OmpA family protein [Spirochaetota bacterium]